MLTRSAIHGQDRALAILERAIGNARIPHALLFAGPDGVGKETVANLLAAGLLCNRGPSLEPCLTCPSCRKTTANVHPDVHLLVPEKNVLNIETVRSLTGRLQMTAYEGRFKIAILRDAHTMNPAAQNALLKTLEEPPGAAVLILVSPAPHLLLSTVRSRCQRIAFAPLDRAFVRARVAAISARDAGDADVSVAVALGEGSLGRSLAILEEGRYANRKTLVDDVQRLAPDAPSRTLDLAEAWSADRAIAGEALEILQLWYRDRLLDACSAPADERCLPDLSPEAPLPLDAALRCLNELHDARAALLGNGNPQLVLEKTFFGVAKAHARAGVS